MPVRLKRNITNMEETAGAMEVFISTAAARNTTQEVSVHQVVLEAIVAVNNFLRCLLILLIYFV